MASLQRIALDFRKNPCSFGLCWPKTALVYKRDLGSSYDDEGTTFGKIDHFKNRYQMSREEQLGHSNREGQSSPQRYSKC
jgi:hypothetical protein